MSLRNSTKEKPCRNCNNIFTATYQTNRHSYKDPYAVYCVPCRKTRPWVKRYERNWKGASQRTRDRVVEWYSKDERKSLEEIGS